MSLIVNHVSKAFSGRTVVKDLSLILDHPQIFGLLGTNGAGKTTTIRMILGILTKDQGEITWRGQPVNRKSVNFGYLPEERGVYPKIKIRDQLTYFAALKGMSKNSIRQAIEYWAEVLNMTQYLDQPAEQLSKGNQQKIQFMTAIIHDPDLIILDEPFSGLDPVNTNLLKNVIIDLAKHDKYIIMSAHQMPVIEEFCSDILMLDHGNVVLQGNLAEIKAQYPANRVKIRTDNNITKFLKSSRLAIENHQGPNYLIKIPNAEAAHQLLSKLVSAEIPISQFEIMQPTLNDIFIEKVTQ